MSAIPCRFSVTCTPCDEHPMGNYTSEGPEQVPTYLALVFPESWDKAGCLSLCESTVSQAEADLCALAQAAACNPPFVTPGTVGDPNDDDGGGGGTTITRTLFFNSEQTCDVSCDDGQPFTYTVPAGTFSALTQEAADARANAYACDKAADNKVCLGALSPLEACVGSAYAGTIDVFIASGLAIADISITSGALPDGLTMAVQTLGDNNLTLNITGTPTSASVSDFTIHVQDSAGNQQSRDFSISTVEITQSTMTNGKVGNAYSQTLTITGTTTGTVTWGVADIPLGLSIDTATGTISGTPESTAEGTSQFTATFTDDNVSCSKQITIEIEPGVPYQDLVWTQVALVQVGTGTAVFSPSSGGTGQNFSALCTCNDVGVGSQGRATYDADITYAGPNLPGIVSMTIVNNEVIADPGINSLNVTYFLNAVQQATVSMPQGYSGPLTLPFTAMAGAMKFRVDVLALAGVNLSISVSGVISNV